MGKEKMLSRVYNLFAMTLIHWGQLTNKIPHTVNIPTHHSFIHFAAFNYVHIGKHMFSKVRAIFPITRPQNTPYSGPSHQVLSSVFLVWSTIRICIYSDSGWCGQNGEWESNRWRNLQLIFRPSFCKCLSIKADLNWIITIRAWP